MPTTYQLSKYKRTVKKNKVKRPALKACPQKKAVCLKLFIKTPKKPNSAKRKVAKVQVLSTKQVVVCYVVGGEHSLQKHSTVMVRGGRRRDLPGVRYVVIRGKYDLASCLNRIKSRSKYGCKKISKMLYLG